MTTEKPKVKRAYVTIRDPESGESVSLTVYNATPKEVARHLRESPPVANPRKNREVRGAMTV